MKYLKAVLLSLISGYAINLRYKEDDYFAQVCIGSQLLQTSK